MFDRTFVINLDRRPDRWNEFLQRFPADWPFAEPERWSAVDGSLCDIPAWFHGGAGAWGCLQTHLDIWRLQVQSRWDAVLVLEDDAVFSKSSVGTMQHTMEIVPDDWEQVYFGGQHLDTNDRPPEVVIQDELILCRNVNRTHAYAIRLEFAEVALRHIEESDWPQDRRCHHVDYRLAELHDSHCVYAPWRFCVGQGRGTSDVRVPNGKPIHVIEHWWNQFPIVDPVTAGVV